MPARRTSREVASRLDIDFLKRARRFPRLVWGTAAIAALLPLAWFAVAWGRGERTAFAARPVSTAHKLFENDCRQCHTQWAPAERLVSFGNAVHSVSNEQCLSCHRSQAHHANQIPAHRDISCASCHREHRDSANSSPVDVADQVCVACHRDLQTTQGPSQLFARDVRTFDASAGSGSHPQFKVHELLKSKPPVLSEPEEAATSGAAVPATPPAGSVAGSPDASPTLLGFFKRPSENAPRWQDAARVQFNHAKHLAAKYDADGKLIAGVRDKNGKMVDLSRNCQACHQTEGDRRYMLPIRFETHCRSCHPLTFDIEQFAAREAPHQTPAIIRGFLTDLYAWDKTSRQTDAKEEDEAWLPGTPPLESLSKDLLETVRGQVDRAEHHLLGHEAKGGCRLCHEVTQGAGESLWTITPTQIPNRWLPHSRFSHDSHRLLNCLECHADTMHSQSTGDVLLPAIDLCRKCHGNTATTGPMAAPQRGHARGRCIECHTYHDRRGESLDGRLNLQLDERAAVTRVEAPP